MVASILVHIKRSSAWSKENSPPKGYLREVTVGDEIIDKEMKVITNVSMEVVSIKPDSITVKTNGLANYIPGEGISLKPDASRNLMTVITKDSPQSFMTQTVDINDRITIVLEKVSD